MYVKASTGTVILLFHIYYYYISNKYICPTFAKHYMIHHLKI
jgi:hypothetical protein